MKLFEVSIRYQGGCDSLSVRPDTPRRRIPRRPAAVQIFSKEKRKERHRSLMDELNRGYFEDFKDFRERQGKVFRAPERLAPATHAPAFPPIQPLASTGSVVPFPLADAAAAAAASLVCVAFRAGAQDMLEAWAAPFSRRFHERSSVALYELALIESPVMALWPFRGMLLRSGASSQARYAMPATYLFNFGGTEELRAALHMSNRLTSYAYLLDGRGRVRWRASGKPDESEMQLLLECTEKLLAEPCGQESPHPSDPGEVRP
jgi:ATPase complex subunit ATP10